MNNLLVSDTNIFIDLINGNLLEDFFDLPYKISTNILVLNELTNNSQLAKLRPFVNNNKLEVHHIESQEFNSIYNLKLAASTSKKLSFQDCSIWHYAKQINARLLTNDSRLRKAASKDGVLVSGSLFVLDELESKLNTSPKKLYKGLQNMMQKNKQARFPLNECLIRLNKWSALISDKKNQKKSKDSDDDLHPGA